MRQFKHKITGVIGELIDGHLYFDRCSGQMCARETLHESFIINSSDWQEIKTEKDYEIVNYQENYVVNNSGMKFINKVIFSAKNKKGIEFKVGDKVEHGIIEKLFLVNGILCVKIRTLGGTLTIGVNKVKHKKEPLFKSQDGVEIFEGDSLYAVTDDFQLCYTSFAQEKDKTVRTFSTKKTAEEYALMNKPCLSVQDMKNTFPNLFYGEEILKKLVKTRL